MTVIYRNFQFLLYHLLAIILITSKIIENLTRSSTKYLIHVVALRMKYGM